MKEKPEVPAAMEPFMYVYLNHFDNPKTKTLRTSIYKEPSSSIFQNLSVSQSLSEYKASVTPDQISTLFDI